MWLAPLSCYLGCCFTCSNLLFPQGSAAQEPIVRSARSMLDSSTYLLETARSLVLNPKDPPTWSILAGHSRTVSDSIKSLITSIRLVLIPPTVTSVSAGLP